MTVEIRPVRYESSLTEDERTDGALEKFDQMKIKGIERDNVTFFHALYVCSFSGDT